jgi:hypothetical protein
VAAVFADLPNRFGLLVGAITGIALGLGLDLLRARR